MQPPEQSAEKVRPVVCDHADSCLADLAATRASPCAEAAIRAASGWTVFVIAFPTPNGDEAPGLTECDRDCLTLLAQVREPLYSCGRSRIASASGLGVPSD